MGYCIVTEDNAKGEREMMKRSGPNTDPCGTPWQTTEFSGSSVFQHTMSH